MPEKQDKIVEIFNSALERNPDERDHFLRRACGQDHALRAEIESLLKRYDSSFLENPAGAELPTISSDAMIGRQIGHYRILREIGHGGMALKPGRLFRGFATSGKPWRRWTIRISSSCWMAAPPKKAGHTW